MGSLVTVPLKFDSVIRYKDPEAVPAGSYSSVRLPAGTPVRCKGKVLDGKWAQGPAVYGTAHRSDHGGGVEVWAYVPDIDAWAFCRVDAMCL